MVMAAQSELLSAKCMYPNKRPTLKSGVLTYCDDSVHDIACRSPVVVPCSGCCSSVKAYLFIQFFGNYCTKVVTDVAKSLHLS